MGENHKKCWSCGHFHAYFTRGYCCLLKEKNGLCGKYNKITLKSDNCDQWYRRRTSKEKRIKIALTSIPEIYKKVAILEELLKEEIDLAELKTIKNE